ncbi:putative transcription regulator protein, MarR [Mycolicibacterium arabiense]|uniref:Putative transcription regulator protein, MarR n=1 Tax=Mycolicibacterium arabiense TaxID=1286181 RepID=A0A7I7S548_9MYCO|nr:MarR family transcriptional regulator [Mycolicibacterium arabiense]BBY51600.1 putative transcription regulator protein, MarR [Mycolicibacterium arabiense]
MSANPLADDVWRAMAAVVFDNRDGWKRDVIETSGLPFSRIRVLRRLARKAMSLREIAEATMMDAPAATVAINDLEDRGLVVRTPDPADRRSKLVSLTQAGCDVVARIDRVEDPAPPSIAALSDDDLRALRDVLAKLTAG